MLNLGKYNCLYAEKETDHGVYLSDGHDRQRTVLLPNRFVPRDLVVGDEIEVFLALDSEDRIVATTQRPKAEVDSLAVLRVKEVNRIGAFLDWGLDKDLLLPFREQPQRVEPGKSYLVHLYIDPATGRIAASRRLTRFYQGDVAELELGDEVAITVWEPARLGWRVIVEEKYIGLVYFNEAFQTLQPGDRLKGYVHALRPEENRVDIRLRPSGFAAVEALKPVILDALADAGGFLPLHAKSSTAEIQETFSFSKRVFKQLIGMLYKERKIEITADGIRLTVPQNEGDQS